MITTKQIRNAIIGMSLFFSFLALLVTILLLDWVLGWQLSAGLILLFSSIGAVSMTITLLFITVMILSRLLKQSQRAIWQLRFLREKLFS